eukprot:9867330-Ditylum_brightwellii.AAC.1
MAKQMEDFRKELHKSQTTLLNAFKIEIQQEMTRQMSIITDMQSKLTTSVQNIVNKGILQMRVAAIAHPGSAPYHTQAPPTPISGTGPHITLVTPSPTQGISSPYNPALGPSSIEHSSITGIASK